MFEIAQVLSGHYDFRKYLCHIGRESTEDYHCGDIEDMTQHTLDACFAFDESRCHLVIIMSNDLSLPAVIK